MLEPYSCDFFLRTTCIAICNLPVKYNLSNSTALMYPKMLLSVAVINNNPPVGKNI